MVSPNMMKNEVYKSLMLVSILINIGTLMRITYSNSFVICWKYNHALELFVHIPKLFMISYIIGFIFTNLGIILLTFRVYLTKTMDNSNVSKSINDSHNMINCTQYYILNSFIFLGSWYPFSVSINNENTRFLDRYRCDYSNKYIFDFKGYLTPYYKNIYPKNNKKSSTYKYSAISSKIKTSTTYQESKNINLFEYCKCFCNKKYSQYMFFNISYPWINSVDGSRPLAPILFLMILFAIQVGIMQQNECLSFRSMIFNFIILFFIVLRGILLIISI